MDLVITGIGLSLQHIPSLSDYTDSLITKLDAPPVMVEHPGEVILQAVRSSSPKHSGLLILHTAAVPEYGYYSSRLDDLFGKVKIDVSALNTLVDALAEINDLLAKDPDLLVVLSETTSTGTAAIAFSNLKHTSDGLARMVVPDQNSIENIPFELVGFAADIKEEGIKLLGSLTAKRSSGRPISLSQPGSFRQPKESILSLIHLTLAIKSKIIPSSNPPPDLITTTSNLSGLVLNDHSLPWLATSQDFLRSAVLVGGSQLTGDWQSIQIIDLPKPVDIHNIHHIKGIDPYIFIITGNNLSLIHI